MTYLIGHFSAGPFLKPAPLTPALNPPVLKTRLTPIRAGVKRATNFSKSGVKGAAFFGPIFTPFWPCYGLWSLDVAKNMLLADLFGQKTTFTTQLYILDTLKPRPIVL